MANSSGEITEGGVGSVLLLILLPCGELAAGIAQRRDQHFVQKLISEPAIEALDKAVLQEFSGRDILLVDVRALTSGQEGNPPPKLGAAYVEFSWQDA